MTIQASEGADLFNGYRLLLGWSTTYGLSPSPWATVINHALGAQSDARRSDQLTRFLLITFFVDPSK